MDLKRDFIFNFAQEAFHNMENAKAAFVARPSTVGGSLILFLIVLGLVVYGINRSKRP